jgi:hypothetical protein
MGELFAPKQDVDTPFYLLPNKLRGQDEAFTSLLRNDVLYISLTITLTKVLAIFFLVFYFCELKTTCTST